MQRHESFLNDMSDRVQCLQFIERYRNFQMYPGACLKGAFCKIKVQIVGMVFKHALTLIWTSWEQMSRRDGVQMGKKRKVNRLDDWLREEYDRKTQEIEDNLSKDGSFDPDRIDGDALYQRIMEKIQEEEGKQEKIKLEKRGKKKVDIYQVGKWVAVFFVSLTGIFLLSMTSEANRTYLKHTVQYMMGDEVVLKMGNNEEVEEESTKIQEKEVIARQEIEEKIGIPVPAFQYEPNDSIGFEYNIELGNEAAAIEYQYKDVILNLRMINCNKADGYGVAVHGKVIKKVKIMRGMISVPVQEIKDPGDQKSTFAAQWEYKNGYYQLSGKIEKEEFLRIVEDIIY